jgi:hypothetical protein
VCSELRFVIPENFFRPKRREEKVFRDNDFWLLKHFLIKQKRTDSPPLGGLTRSVKAEG